MACSGRLSCVYLREAGERRVLRFSGRWTFCKYSTERCMCKNKSHEFSILSCTVTCTQHSVHCCATYMLLPLTKLVMTCHLHFSLHVYVCTVWASVEYTLLLRSVSLSCRWIVILTTAIIAAAAPFLTLFLSELYIRYVCRICQANPSCKQPFIFLIFRILLFADNVNMKRITSALH